MSGTRRLDPHLIEAEKKMRTELAEAIFRGNVDEINEALGAWGAALIEKATSRIRDSRWS